jgi:hypothetical protein
MKKLLLYAIAASLFCSCKMQELYLNVIEPAPVTIPAYIKNAGIVDRSDPADATKTIDAVDKVLSLEGANLDKEGAAAALAGLTDELGRNTRFTEVKTIQAEKVGSPGLGIFPPPLSWEAVDAICRENDTDALFSLEIFDTDTKISYQVRKAQGNNKTLLGAITGIEQQADMLTIVKTGWRIYDPSSKSILDEIAIAKNLTFSAKGLTPVIAASALIDRKEAVKKVGNLAGLAFAQRILPYEIRVSRDYYVKGTDNFVIAMRKARTGNWDQAGELWKVETENRDDKIAGRACYNMAIISEINGSLDTALEWARKSYEDYNNRKALRYIDILEYRKQSNRILESQEER